MAVDPDDVTRPANSDPAGSPVNGIQVEMRALKQRVKDNRADEDPRITALEALVANLGFGASPIGAICDYGGVAAPTNWLLCDGSLVSRTTYADLFAAIGANFGAGDGVTTFALPDFRGRTTIGEGTGSGLSTRAIGEIGGEEEHVLTEDESAPHTHLTMSAPAAGESGQALTGPTGSNPYFASSWDTASQDEEYAGKGVPAAHIPDISLSGDSSGAHVGHNTMQPFVVVAKIIRYK